MVSICVRGIVQSVLYTFTRKCLSELSCVLCVTRRAVVGIYEDGEFRVPPTDESMKTTFTIVSSFNHKCIHLLC